MNELVLAALDAQAQVRAAEASCPPALPPARGAAKGGRKPRQGAAARRTPDHSGNCAGSGGGHRGAAARR